MSYRWRKMRVEPCRGLWARWRATPIRTDTPDPGQLACGFDLEPNGDYVLWHRWRFSAHTRERAIERCKRWMDRENAKEDRMSELTNYVDA